MQPLARDCHHMLKMDITFKVILDIYAKKFNRRDSFYSGYNRRKRLRSSFRIVEDDFFSFGQIYDHTITVVCKLLELGHAGLGHAELGQRDWDTRYKDSGTGTRGTGSAGLGHAELGQFFCDSLHEKM